MQKWQPFVKKGDDKCTCPPAGEKVSKLTFLQCKPIRIGKAGRDPIFPGPLAGRAGRHDSCLILKVVSRGGLNLI